MAGPGSRSDSIRCMYTSPNWKRLRRTTPTRCGSSPRSDSANTLAMSGADPGAMRATIRAWCMRGAPSGSAGQAGRGPAFGGGLLDAVPDQVHLDLGVAVDVVRHPGVVDGRLGLHREVLRPDHARSARHLLVAPVDVHVVEGSRLHAAGPDAELLAVGLALGDPAPHGAVLVGVHGQPEGGLVPLPGEDLDGGVLAEQAGPVRQVVGHLPDQVQRCRDGDLVLCVSGHFTLLS